MNSVKLAFNCSKWNPSLKEWCLAGSFIQPEEQSRIGNFYFKDDAKLSLTVRLLIRFAIVSCKDLDWEDIILTRTARGKPMLTLNDLTTNKSIHFNATHDGDFAAVVADTNHNVGIDIMHLNRKPGGDLNYFFSIMSSKFTKNEWKQIYSYDSQDHQLKSFYRHWCLKESYVKAIGDGITYPLRNLDFHTKSNIFKIPKNEDAPLCDTKLLLNGIPKNSWTFEETILDDHCIAVAKDNSALSSVEHSNFKVITFDNIKSVALELCNESDIQENFIKCYQNPYKVNDI